MRATRDAGGVVGRLLLALASVLLVVGIAEALLRWREPAPETGLRDLHEPRPGEPWLYALRPGARVALGAPEEVVYAVNEDGYRGPRVPLEREPGTFRVLVLGDSVAFGYGVSEEDTFPRRLERALDRRSPSEVLNFGVGGYNPYNEAALFEGRGARYRPDLVLLQFCVNDLNDPTLHFDAQTRLRLPSIPDAAFPDPSRRAGPASLRGAEDACRGLRLCARIASAWQARLGAPPDAATLRSTFAPRELPPGPARAWLAGHYRRVAAAAAAGGARFAVVIFPYRDQVEGAASARLQTQLASLAEAEGFPALDLLPAFRGADPGGALFLDLWHPTAAGHALAADAIHARLDALGWLPRGAPGGG